MGMKLKSGADLCGFELSRFCVQNDVAIPDAPASGRKYFHTGTGMEGKYSLLGRERIYTGTSWRAAAYVDDLANLDLATNADYLALKEKVDLLSGEVDTDAIINNMKEVTAFLSGFAEDANLMTMLNNKLDKSGGTLTGTLTLSKEGSDIFVINRLNSSSPTTITYRKDDVLLGRMGFDASTYEPVAQVFGTYHTLIHSGNVGDYALKTDGSNQMNAPLRLATIVDLTKETGLYVGQTNISGGGAFDYASFVNISDGRNSSLQLSWFRNISVPKLVARISENGNWSDWKTIAFTDSNVASAQALKHSNGTVGAVVNSSGNVTIGSNDLAGTDAKLYVDGKLYAGNYFSLLNGKRWIFGAGVITGEEKDFVFSDATSYAIHMLIDSETSSVGIGLRTPQAQLHVAKDIIANGTIACKGVAAEGSTPVGTVDKWAGSIATGTKSQTYTHGLGTTDITVAIYEKNGNEWVQILTDVDIVNANTIRVTFGANTTVEHRIVVMG